MATGGLPAERHGAPGRPIVVSRLLVAVDGSWQSTNAVKLAAEMAKGLGARLTILHVVPLPPGKRASSPPERGGQTILRAAAQVAEAAGVTAEVALETGRVADGILAFAARYEPDVIIMGSRGMSREKGLLLGSVSQAVSQYAPCSVLIVR